MDIKGSINKITRFITKYRYVVIILLIGLVLITIPELGSDRQTATQIEKEASAEPSVEEKLSSILSQVEGAGEVRVLLTEAAGQEILYQTNENITAGDNTSGNNKDTVIITDAQRNQNGLIQQIKPPVYLGAIIACQGADDPTVQLAIVDAVSKITGLGANRISVLKMK